MKYLVVVDMQNDFVTGALKNEDAEKIIPNVVAKVQQYGADPEGKIFFTKDTHNSSYLDTIEGTKLPVAHCIEGTSGWELIPELNKYSNHHIIPKVTFGSAKLGNMIRNDIFEEWIDGNTECSIEVIGLCTDICVLSNATLLKAFCPNTPITVDAACCAGVTPESHDNALNAMKMIHIDVINQGEEPWRK